MFINSIQKTFGCCNHFLFLDFPPPALFSLDLTQKRKTTPDLWLLLLSSSKKFIQSNSTEQQQKTIKCTLFFLLLLRAHTLTNISQHVTLHQLKINYPVKFNVTKFILCLHSFMYQILYKIFFSIAFFFGYIIVYKLLPLLLLLVVVIIFHE
jgi:hypothetical protein